MKMIFLFTGLLSTTVLSAELLRIDLTDVETQDSVMLNMGAATGIGPIGDANRFVLFKFAKEGSTVEFPFFVHNTNSKSISGKLRVKPFLIPAEDDQLKVSQKGVVLGYENFEIEIEPKRTQYFYFKQFIPRIPQGSYLFGVLINSNRTIGSEDNQKEFELFETKLHRIGNLSNDFTNGQIDSTFGDIYSEVFGEFSTRVSYLYHGLRTIYSAPEIRSHSAPGLWMRFFLVDRNRLRLKVLPYIYYEFKSDGVPKKFVSIEKRGFYLELHHEVNERGEAIGVDYYNNGPYVGHIAPGKYELMTMANSIDRYSERDYANNIDLKAVEINSFEAYRPALWLANPERSLITNSIIFDIGSLPANWDSQINWRAVLTEGTPGLSIVTQEGRTDYRDRITVQFDGAKAPERKLRDYIKITASGFEARPTIVPVEIFNGQAASGQLELSTEEIDCVAKQYQRSERKIVVLTNSDSKSVTWMINSKLPKWLKISKTSGSIEGGGRLKLTIECDASQLATRYYHRTIRFHSSNSAIEKTLSINMSVTK